MGAAGIDLLTRTATDSQDLLEHACARPGTGIRVIRARNARVDKRLQREEIISFARLVLRARLPGSDVGH